MNATHSFMNFPALEQVLDRAPLTISPDALLVDVITLMSQAQGSNCALSDLGASPDSDLPGQKRSSCVLGIGGTQVVGI